MRRLRVLILGSTGSIGTQALEVIAANPDRFEVVGLAAGGGNPDLLARQRAETGVTNVAVAEEGAAAQVGDVTYAGPDAATRLVENTEADVVLNALVGALGLQPTLAALHSGARLALANKESLIAGGPLVLRAAKPGQIVPVDSEHSALAQCLLGGTHDEVAKLVLTASGGPFRGASAADLESVTPEQAGAHPTWSMGPMNTLNSASLVNKGLELIETHLLFSIPYDRIEVVVHPQSIVHSMVTFIDGSTLAQASPPDMKLPIALALGWPNRVPDAAPACDFRTASTWEFEPLDAEVFPAVELAREAGQRGGCLTAVYNAANEEAAEAFLDGRIRFPAIVRTIAEVLHAADQWAAEPATVDDVLDAQRWARDRAQQAQYPGRSSPPNDVRSWHRRIRALHLGFSRAARMRAHVGGARDRHEGAPLLRRLRPHAVVDAPAEQAWRDRVRRQGHPAGRLLRHRGHDLGRGARTRRTPVCHVQAEDVEACRRPVRRPGHEFRHRPCPHLCHRDHLGPAQPAPADHRYRRRNRLCRSANQQRSAGGLHWSGPGGRGRYPGRRCDRQGRRHLMSPPSTKPCHRAPKASTARPRSSSSATANRSPRWSMSPGPSGSPARATRRSTVGAIGIAAAQFGPTQYNPLSAVPATFAFTGDLAVELGKSLAKIPTKIGALVDAIGGGERDPETPISVVGASIIGGDTVDHGLWVAFWFFLAQLNFVLGAINLIPLLPFDGGHIAIAVFEKIRNMIRSARGMVAAAPVNYLKLMPATYVILIVVVGYMLLTVTADLVNPIRLFQ